MKTIQELSREEFFDLEMEKLREEDLIDIEFL